MADPSPSDPNPEFEALIAAAERLQLEVGRLLPDLADARRRYARSRTAEDRARLDEIQAAAEALQARYAETVDAMGEMAARATGLSREEIESLVDEETEQETVRISRATLTEDQVATSAYIDDHLPAVLDYLESRLPPGWLDAEEGPVRLEALTQLGSFLSLTKNVRAESEAPSVHRLRQTLRVGRDYLTGQPLFDHFAGATVLTQAAQIGRRLSALQEVGGWEARLERLWAGTSAEVDSTVLELLVGAGCAARGRTVEFLPQTHEKSPDLRAHDPFPLVIECKRQRALTPYELGEEVVMREVFRWVRAKAGPLGMSGRFALRLSVEVAEIDAEEVASRLVSQRLAPRPDHETAYTWGRVSFVELPWRLPLSGRMRLYSPDLLEEAFGWRGDLPDWDGLCCSISNAGAVVLDEAHHPLGLVWNNTSEGAVRKRSWAPVKLFAEGLKQVPPGEFGIIYTAYVEGGREAIADARVEALTARMQELDHAGNIRVPIAFVPRLYPRARRGGQPDLIESSVRYCSKAYGEPALFDVFPAAVFTGPN